MRVHFIAIGGAAMHNLALALAKKGYMVTGSDDEIFEPSRTRLEKAGLLPGEFGWFPQKINSRIDAIILGMHARHDNPELLRAQELGIKIFSYPEFLYEQTKNKIRVVIAGSHGKTTVTSMIMHVLRHTGFSFDYMVGAQIDGFDTMVSLNEESPLAIFEGDEYLTSPIDPRPKFHLYKPSIALINGIAWDHINVFPTFDNYCQQFQTFVELIEKRGKLFYFNEDVEVQKVIQLAKRTDIIIKPFTCHPYKTENEKVSLVLPDETFLPVNVFGKHNMQNIAGAKEICLAAGLSENEFYKGIATFKGSAKRLQLLFEDKSTSVYLDFAHAPSKVAATVNAVREQFLERKLIAFLELHTFSSLTRDFLQLYRNTLEKADTAIVYFNPEVVAHKKLEKITPDDIRNAFAHRYLTVLNNLNELPGQMKKLGPKAARVVVYMSSGNMNGTTHEELIRIAREE
jgi:UDP-N-acetylmuramate: L-alanyl-gamma-D-glutamyl-meso-diaminopimelate ligase